MAEQPPGPFKVVRSEAIRQQLREWGERAKELGIVSEYVDMLRVMEEQLATDPLTWGDPVHRVPSLGLFLFRRIHWKIKVLYAVHEEQQVVFIISCELVLSNPLLPRDDNTSGNGSS